METSPTPLNALKLMPFRMIFNRIYALVYLFAIASLLYRHIHTLLNSTAFPSFLVHAAILFADLLFAFMWSTTQAYHMRQVTRTEFPENLEKAVREEDFPAMDVFICTADPTKEPPLDVVNTALSVMAYDYPAEKISVYVSDDGGSELTLFAFMEAAKFARHWLPFCRENKVVDRCPDVFFTSGYGTSLHTQKLKMMYESMKERVEKVCERGKMNDEYITNEQERLAFENYWTPGFSRQHHPTIIQVLLESKEDKDTSGYPMPRLVYISREKSKTSQHHYKGGALNTLIRVSGVMTNAPIILTLDCDMYSNDPSTPKRALCYFMDRSVRPNLGYIQFPQRFHGLNEADIYASEHKHIFQINTMGMDGFSGPNYYGTGCFFWRRTFFGGPLTFVRPEIEELGPDYVVTKPIMAPEMLELAHNVARCNYEDQSDSGWGYKMGFKYGTVVEDTYTGYRLTCEGWNSIYCNPERPAFLGDIPISLGDALNQNKRWGVGLLEVALNKYSPLTYGTRTAGFIMGYCYTHLAFWPFWLFPVTIYSYLPQLTLLNGLPIFPKTSDNVWILVYAFLFIGANAQDCYDFISTGGTCRRWWSDQRMWLMRALSSYLFAGVEFVSKQLGISNQGFTVTSKVVDDEQGKRYEQGVFEFGAPSPLFVPIAVAAIVNLAAFLKGIGMVLGGGRGRSLDLFGVQMFVAGYGVLNSLPLYHGMLLRSDKGRMPTKITVISSFIAWAIYISFSFFLGSL
ncbi:cellulose synthase-like protein G2 [Ipomoea triloba]|uniref:cellulose synthase-like protein G2 n=1 Tax=Ipomoea triloba TaxID=35885 RepID=UPI00125E5EA8|nr:cellulose synthase-like protein G2 [Ipomoea triloba]